MPGDTATWASCSMYLANSTEPIFFAGSGISAQTNMVPLGFGNLPAGAIETVDQASRAAFDT